MLLTTVTGLAAASLASASALLPRGACYEGTQKLCYGVNGGESQDVDPEDVQYAADYLRYLDEQNKGSDRLWTMPKESSVGDCAEWAFPIPNAGTVLALAKHVNPRVASSISFGDLADAIDGTDGIDGCGKNGGQKGAKADTSNPLYNTDEYKKSGAKPEGIVVKIVRAPDS